MEDNPQPLSFDFSNGSVIRERNKKDEDSTKEVVNTIVKKTISPELSRLIIGAAATASALTWTDYFRSLFDKGGALHRFKRYGQLMVAIIATLVALIIVMALQNRAKESKLDEKGNLRE
jgi:hypothetical protein